MGFGTFKKGGAVGILFHYPIKFEFYYGKPVNDLWVQLEEMPSSAVEGDKVQILMQVKSTYDENLSIAAGTAPFIKWEIIDKVTKQPISSVKFDGYIKTESGYLEIAANGETAVFAEFDMPKNDVIVRFEINKDGTTPQELVLENNAFEAQITSEQPITATGDFELDYNVLSRDVSFPLGGGPMVANLEAPLGSLYGNARGYLSVINRTPNIYSELDSYNININEPVGTVVINPQINTTIHRKDTTYDNATRNYDNPLDNKWLPGPASKTVTGRISFSGEVYGNYSYETVGVNPDGTLYDKTVYGSTSASFRPGNDYRNITTYIYNGKPTVPAKTFENKIDNNNTNSLRKNMFWTSEPYKLDVIRWMYRQSKDGSLYGGIPVLGAYQRTFTQQNSGVINWSIASTMEKDYKKSREAARVGDRRTSEYDKAVFASDIAFKNIDYPIKSGYYFNPTGSYTFNVETVTYKPNKGPTKDHEDLVEALINSFRYETDFMYINNSKEAVNIQNEKLSKVGNEYKPRSAALTAKDPTGVDGIKLLNVDKTYKINEEELKHSQKSDEFTHNYFKEILEGYEESGTLGSLNNYKYREYIKDGQSMFKITEKTTVTITINPDNKKLYTYINMPDGKYTVSAWIGDIKLGDMNNEYKKIGTLKGIYPLDRIEVTVKGSLYDDQNPIIKN